MCLVSCIGDRCIRAGKGSATTRSAAGLRDGMRLEAICQEEDGGTGEYFAVKAGSAARRKERKAEPTRFSARCETRFFQHSPPFHESLNAEEGGGHFTPVIQIKKHRLRGKSGK